jgi:hypothetical protein
LNAAFIVQAVCDALQAVTGANQLIDAVNDPSVTLQG